MNIKKEKQEKILSKEQKSAQKRVDTGKKGEDFFKSRVNINKYHLIVKNAYFKNFFEALEPRFPELVTYLSYLQEAYSITFPTYNFDKTDKFFAADMILIEKRKWNTIKDFLNNENELLLEKIDSYKNKIIKKPNLKIEKRFKILKSIFPVNIEIEGIKFLSAKNVQKKDFEEIKFFEMMNNFNNYPSLINFDISFAMQQQNKELYSYFKIQNIGKDYRIDLRSFNFDKGEIPSFEMHYKNQIIIGKTHKNVLELFKIKNEGEKRNNFMPEQLQLIENSKQCKHSTFSIQIELEKIMLLTEKQKSILFYLFTMNYQVFKHEFVFEDDFSKIC
jgi:hypothetical protein